LERFEEERLFKNGCSLSFWLTTCASWFEAEKTWTARRDAEEAEWDAVW
jgi:hypothetical protein